MELKTENLRALLLGNELTKFQKALAREEYKKLILFAYDMEKKVEQLVKKQKTKDWMHLDHVCNVADSLANKSQYDSEKWKHTQKTYGNTGRMATDVEYGFARAYEHLRDSVIPNTKKVFQ